MVVEGDSEGDDDLNQQLLEEQLVKEKSPPKEPEKPFKREEEALNALNNVLDTLCKSKMRPKDEDRDNENSAEQGRQDDENRKSSKDLYDNLEDFSSGESSLPNEGESDSDAVEGLLEAASEVSSSEDEMLKRNEAAEAAGNDENATTKEAKADDQRHEEPSKSSKEAPVKNVPDGVKTNGATSFKLKRKTGLEEGELSESNSNGSHVSRRIRDLKRRKRRTRSQRNPLAPLRSRSPSPLSVRFSGDSSSDDSPVKAPLVLDRTAVRKVVLSPSPLRDEGANNATGNSSTWKKLNSSTKNRNYRQAGNEITATNHLQTTLTVVATANKKVRRRPQAYQVFL